MGLESGTVISNFVITNPTSDDPVSEGDNHLQLIKQILQTQFPGELGAGFAEVITSTETELNYLQGATSNIQNQIDNIIAGTSANLFAPVGTVMVFASPTPPLGWTKVTNVDDAVMRIMTTEDAGDTGGSVSIVNMPYTHVHNTSGHAITAEESPPHSHFVAAAIDGSGALVAGSFMNRDWASGSSSANNYQLRGNTVTAPTVGKSSVAPVGNGGFFAEEHNHGPTANNAGSFINPKYINIMQAVKT
jgi:hypothetical protein